jgi:hypothetical protein
MRELREEYGRIDAVDEEKVHFDLFAWSLGGTGVVD